MANGHSTNSKANSGGEATAKSGALMIEMLNLALENSFYILIILKALVSSLSVHVHLISSFRALWEIANFSCFISPQNVFYLLSFTFSPFSIRFTSINNKIYNWDILKQ